MLQRFWLALLIVLLFASPVWSAPFITTQVISGNNVASQVEVDGVTLTGTMILSDDGTYMKYLDLVGYVSGRHIFRVRVQDESGWWSDWSGPLDAGKPDMLGVVSIREN